MRDILRHAAGRFGERQGRVFGTGIPIASEIKGEYIYSIRVPVKRENWETYSYFKLDYSLRK